MLEKLFLRCSEDIKSKYLSYPGLERSYQPSLYGEWQYVVVDFETTGFDPERDQIIEVAAARVSHEEVSSRFESLVEPTVPIPTFIKLLTGIDDDTVAGCPVAEEVLAHLVSFIGSDTVVAYSRLEDYFLRSKLPQLGLGAFSNPYIDAMDLAIMLLPCLGGHRQADLASIWDLEVGRQHRAADDVESLVSVFNVLLRALYNMPLPALKAVVDHSPARRGGLSLLLSRVLEERSGGRPVDPLKLEHFVRKDRFWERIPPLNGESPSGTVHASDVRSVFDPEGPLARQFEDYEERDEQLQMAEATRRAFADQDILLVEAGTGTGKSLAYLVPAVLWSVATDLPLVVSTRTLNLQDQLFTQDLPMLAEALVDKRFRYSVLKGYRNYICLRKLQKLINGRRRLSENQLGVLGMLINWVSEYETGDISLLNVSHLRGMDELVLANHRECPGPKCRFARSGDCFYRKALYRAKRSNVVVVNHSLLLSGVSIPFRSAVVDEAHTLEDVATESFTSELSYRDTQRFLSSLYSPADESGFLADLSNEVNREFEESDAPALDRVLSEATEAVEVCLEDLERLFIALSELHQGGNVQARDLRFSIGVLETIEYARVEAEAEKLIAGLDRLSVLLQRFSTLASKKSDGSDDFEFQLGDLLGKADRLGEVEDTLKLFLGEADGNLVKWATVAPADRFEYQAIRISPIDVGDYLVEFLYEELDSIVMTSATLTVKDSFDFFRSRVGLGPGGPREPVEAILDSSFDYQRQMQILVLHDMPEPGSKDYESRLSQVLNDVIVAAAGGVLALFTNRRLMMQTYDKLVDSLGREGLTLLCQRSGHSRRRLAEEFVGEESASLLGTSSFWEGVDARGSTLKLVAVTRLPFESPGRPVFEARSELVKMSGGSDFSDLSLPMAALRLKQGVGRLIRTRQDMGQIVIMDSRINTRNYGKTLLGSLPNARRRNISIAEVKRAISGFGHGS